MFQVNLPTSFPNMFPIFGVSINTDVKSTNTADTKISFEKHAAFLLCFTAKIRCSKIKNAMMMMMMMIMMRCDER